MDSLDPVTPKTCPFCAARDVVVLEDGELFCPWCLWSHSPELSLERGTQRDSDYLEELAAAFERP